MPKIVNSWILTSCKPELHSSSVSSSLYNYFWSFCSYITPPCIFLTQFLESFNFFPKKTGMTGGEVDTTQKKLETVLTS